MGQCPMKGIDLGDLIDGHVNDEIRQTLIRHLGEDCPDCDQIFLDSLDEKEAILMALVLEKKTLVDSQHEHQKSRIYQQIIQKKRAEKSNWIYEIANVLIGLRPATVAVASLALVLVSWTIYRLAEPPKHYDGIKGPSAVSQKITLSGWVGSETNGKKIEGPVTEGMVLRPDQDVFFKFHLSQDGFVYLTATINEIYKPIYPEHPEEAKSFLAGDHELKIDGEVKALPLQELVSEGRKLKTKTTEVTFCAIWSLTRLFRKDLVQSTHKEKSCLTVTITP